MSTRILVPLDGSRLAEQSLPCAMTLGRALAAELVLFRAVSIPSDVLDTLDGAGLKPEPLMGRLESDASDYLTAMARHVQSKDLSASYTVRRGPAAETIVDHVREVDISLIVMTTHGYTGIKRWRHGSVAERVLQSASVPVLLVRANKDAAPQLPDACPCRRILVPLDGSVMAEQVLPVVGPMAAAMGCELSLLRVLPIQTGGPFAAAAYPPLAGGFDSAYEAAGAYLERLAGPLREQGIAVSTITWVAPVAEAISDHAELDGTDLIAMCTHGRTGIARWALGSVADRVLRGGNKPILLVRAR